MLLSTTSDVDAELHAEFPRAPPLPNSDASFRGVDDTRKGYSIAPIRAIAYENEPIHNGGPPLKLCFRFEEKHLYSSSFLRNYVDTLEDDEEMEAANRASFLDELKWFLAVRKYWRSLLHFIDRP